MSEITGRITASVPGGAIATAHESYSFACMRCGHGWEQSYTIEHYVDGAGHEFVMYVVDGQRVPSPLTRPTCMNCGGHVVRIMKAGQVSSVLDLMHGKTRPTHRRRHGDEEPGDAVSSPDADAERKPDHHWHLSDLLHPFRHHHKTD